MSPLTLRLCLVAGAVILSGAAFAGPTAHPAAPAIQPSPDPKKKNAGDACKSTSECQSYLTCSKVGEKNVCTAPAQPPDHIMPPT